MEELFPCGGWPDLGGWVGCWEVTPSGYPVSLEECHPCGFHRQTMNRTPAVLGSWFLVG